MSRTAKTVEVLLTSQTVLAQVAGAMGPVAKVVPNGEVLDRVGAGPLDNTSAVACRPEVRIFSPASERPSLDIAFVMERHTFQLMFATADRKEAMEVFFEKRSPTFMGL
jgi:enoyl-CoA hydratase